MFFKTLTDPRFEFTDSPDEADVCWAMGLARSELIKKAQEKGSFINQFPEDDVMLIQDNLVALVHSTYSSFAKGKSSDVIPESFFVRTQLPAFMGRFKEIESDDFPAIWSVVDGKKVTDVPCLSNNLDWILRLSESNTLIQKYQRRPFLLDNHKAVFRFTVCLKSVVPLEAYVLKEVAIMTAPKAFTLSNEKMGDELTHSCTD